MAIIALRSPQFKFHSVPSSGVLSTQADITIAGTLRYSIIKNNPDTLTGFNVDISELTRDYLNIQFGTNNTTDSIAVTTSIRNFLLINGTNNPSGNQAVVGSPTTYSDIGVEGYGVFSEQANPTLPFGRTLPTWLLASETQGTSATDTFAVYVPEGEAGRVAGMTNSTTLVTVPYNANQTIIQNSPIGLPNLKINRIGCTKYGIGTKVTFINKYGAQQDLWFFLKKTDTISRTNEKYTRNTLEYVEDEQATYNLTIAPRAIFNTQAKSTITLNSGYYPETAVPYFEQLLLSEYVWIKLPRVESGLLSAIPFTVKNSSVILKTSVNDRLIEYTIEFEQAADHINNIR